MRLLGCTPVEPDPFRGFKIQVGFDRAGELEVFADRASQPDFFFMYHNTILEQDYGAPEVIGLERYAEQATPINARVWRRELTSP